MKNFLLSLLDWIYKKKCYFCGSSKESAKMCSKCYEKMIPNGFSECRKVCGVSVYAAGFYESNIQKLIRGLKYHGQRELAYYQAKFMWEYWQNLDLGNDFVVVPVPLHKKRQKKRQYNHMELVALEFCKCSGFDYDFDLLKRVKETKPQYRLKYKERQENLKDAFAINKDKLNSNISQKSILLIDDICTTGSTFESMITELNKNNIYNITCLVTATVDF